MVTAAFMMTTASGGGLEPTAADMPPLTPTDPAFVEIVSVSGLPHVLLIGDSISIGYTLPVREKLKRIANVNRPPENCADTACGLAHLDAWLEKGPWDVIHFNFGLHDLKYLDDKGNYVPPEKGNQVAPPRVYRQRLRELALRLKATEAKLIFATTTPVPRGCLGRVAGNEAIYNKVACDIMKELDVPIDDLCVHIAEQEKKTPSHPLSEIQLPSNVHFTPEGYDQLANFVVASIEKVLLTPS